jgi:hypothetical protein
VNRGRGGVRGFRGVGWLGRGSLHFALNSSLRGKMRPAGREIKKNQTLVPYFPLGQNETSGTTVPTFPTQTQTRPPVPTSVADDTARPAASAPPAAPPPRRGRCLMAPLPQAALSLGPLHRSPFLGPPP